MCRDASNCNYPFGLPQCNEHFMKEAPEKPCFTLPNGECTAEGCLHEAKHLDKGKLGFQYILAMPGLRHVAAVGDFGAIKYGRWNYRSGMSWMKLAGSCSRHLIAWLTGETFDSESQLHHLAHLVYDALMLLDYYTEVKGTDDRFRPN